MRIEPCSILLPRRWLFRCVSVGSVSLTIRTTSPRQLVTGIFESEYAKVHIQVNIHWNIHLRIGHSLNIHEFFRCCYLTGREMEVQLSLIGIGPVLY